MFKLLVKIFQMVVIINNKSTLNSQVTNHPFKEMGWSNYF